MAGSRGPLHPAIPKAGRRMYYDRPPRGVKLIYTVGMSIVVPRAFAVRQFHIAKYRVKRHTEPIECLAILMWSFPMSMLWIFLQHYSIWSIQSMEHCPNLQSSPAVISQSLHLKMFIHRPRVSVRVADQSLNWLIDS